MNSASRTAGCPAAERNILTKPTGGASPVSTSVGVDSPLAQPRQQGRAVPLSRRRKVRDNFLGREGRPSQSPVRKARWQTLYSCLVQPARRVDTSIPNESLAPVSRASSAMSFTKNWNHSVPFAVRPLDFRDHIAVRRHFCGHGLAALVGCYTETMGVAVIVRDKELGLSVVAIHYLGYGVTQLQKTLPERLNVARRPVESYPLEILRLVRRTSSLIEPEIQPLVMNHAPDEATVLPHGTIHG